MHNIGVRDGKMKENGKNESQSVVYTYTGLKYVVQRKTWFSFAQHTSTLCTCIQHTRVYNILQPCVRVYNTLTFIGAGKSVSKVFFLERK